MTAKKQECGYLCDGIYCLICPEAKLNMKG